MRILVSEETWTCSRGVLAWVIVWYVVAQTDLAMGRKTSYENCFRGADGAAQVNGLHELWSSAAGQARLVMRGSAEGFA